MTPGSDAQPSGTPVGSRCGPACPGVGSRRRTRRRDRERRRRRRQYPGSGDRRGASPRRHAGPSDRADDRPPPRPRRHPDPTPTPTPPPRTRDPPGPAGAPCRPGSRAGPAPGTPRTPPTAPRRRGRRVRGRWRDLRPPGQRLSHVAAPPGGRPGSLAGDDGPRRWAPPSCPPGWGAVQGPGGTGKSLLLTPGCTLAYPGRRHPRVTDARSAPAAADLDRRHRGDRRRRRAAHPRPAPRAGTTCSATPGRR